MYKKEKHILCKMLIYILRKMCYIIVTKINTPPPRNAHAWNPQASKSVEGLVRENALEKRARTR